MVGSTCMGLSKRTVNLEIVNFYSQFKDTGLQYLNYGTAMKNVTPNRPDS